MHLQFGESQSQGCWEESMKEHLSEAQNIAWFLCCLAIRIVTRVYAPRFFVSSQQKFGEMDIKAPWRVTALGGQTVL